jgi:large subunit ribosomal protein L10
VSPGFYNFQLQQGGEYMPAKLKFEKVEALREMISRTQAVFVAEYRGLTVAQITALRAQVRAAGGEMKVAKNTLMKIAMEQEGLPSFPDETAYGPNVFTLSYGDPVAVAKALRDFSKEKTNKAFVLKGGVLGQSLLGLEQVNALADLPSRDVLIGQVVRTIAAPIAGLLTVLNGPVQGLANCLNQLREKKEEAA